MAILTFSEMRAYAGTRRYSSLSEARTFENSIAKSAGTKPKIFISHAHAHATRQEVLNAINFLNKMGSESYVDWLDPQMPTTTSGETALALRSKITTCNKFILLLTPEALASRWVSWELGYADAKKGLDDIALLPVRHEGESFPGNEYLRIYPAIKTAVSQNIAVFPANEDQGVKFVDWLTT